MHSTAATHARHGSKPRTARRHAGPGQVAPGYWSIDGSASALWVSAAVGAYGSVQGRFHRLSGTVELGRDPAESTVRVEVDTGSLSSGRPMLDRLLQVCGVVDTTANPWIRFTSVGLRPHQAGTGWWLDGALSTSTGTRDLTLHLLAPAATGTGRASFRALGELPPRHAGELLGVRRGLLHGPLALALFVEAVRPPSPSYVPR
ncbi:MAG: YceI family protein [Actinomycetia bacterium]|nr:YceI family protein [Actinomycetes bacterium]